MTLRTAGLAVAVGSPGFALYILGVILLLDIDAASGQYALAVPVALFLGFVPWGFLLDRMTAYSRHGVAKSGTGWMAGFVAVLDAGKGALAVALGWAAIDTPEGTMAVGLAVLAGDLTSRLLFRYGRVGPVSVGALLVIEPLAGVIAVAFVPLAILVARRGLPGGLLVAVTVVVAPLVLSLVGEAEYVHLFFAGPAAALMFLQYRKQPSSDPVPDATVTAPTRPGNT